MAIQDIGCGIDRSVLHKDLWDVNASLAAKFAKEKSGVASESPLIRHCPLKPDARRQKFAAERKDLANAVNLSSNLKMQAICNRGGQMDMKNENLWSAIIVVFIALTLGSLSPNAWTQAPQKPVPAAPAVQKDSLKLMLQFEDADLREFINQVAPSLGLTPIIIDPDVKGKVTLRTPSPMSKDDVLPLFHMILKNNNAALIKQGDAYQIVPIAAAVKKGVDAIE